MSAPSDDTRLLPETFAPTERDVICGWARQNHQHGGNKRFRELIDEYAEQYIAAQTKLDKTQVIVAVIDKIRKDSPEGGFVKKDFYSGRWYEIGNEKARDKVGHAIRKASDLLLEKKEPGGTTPGEDGPAGGSASGEDKAAGKTRGKGGRKKKKLNESEAKAGDSPKKSNTAKRQKKSEPAFGSSSNDSCEIPTKKSMLSPESPSGNFQPQHQLSTSFGANNAEGGAAAPGFFGSPTSQQQHTILQQQQYLFLPNNLSSMRESGFRAGGTSAAIPNNLGATNFADSISSSTAHAAYLDSQLNQMVANSTSFYGGAPDANRGGSLSSPLPHLHGGGRIDPLLGLRGQRDQQLIHTTNAATESIMNNRVVPRISAGSVLSLQDELATLRSRNAAFLSSSAAAANNILWPHAFAGGGANANAGNNAAINAALTSARLGNPSTNFAQELASLRRTSMMELGNNRSLLMAATPNFTGSGLGVEHLSSAAGGLHQQDLELLGVGGGGRTGTNTTYTMADYRNNIQDPQNIMNLYNIGAERPPSRQGEAKDNIGSDWSRIARHSSTSIPESPFILASRTND